MATQSEEIELTEFIEGARAVNPDITLEDLLELAKNPDQLNIIRDAKEIRILIIGKTGTGKSTLVNGLIGQEFAKVCLGLATSGVSEKVECYEHKIEGAKVLVYDSPGLQDGSGKEESYLEELYSKCHNVDLIIFAIRYADNRFVPNNPNAVAMKTFTGRFGAEVWRKTIVVLTCANLVEDLNPQLRLKSRKEKGDFFHKLKSDYQKAIHDTLIKEAVPGDIVKKVKVVPTGIEFCSELIDGTLWFTNFWFECLTAIQTFEVRATLIKVNKKRFKFSKSVKKQDFMEPLDSQPIVIPAHPSKGGVPIATIGTVMGPAAIGALLGAVAVVGGPIGLVGIPVGMFTGMIVGAFVAAHRNNPKEQ